MHSAPEKLNAYSRHSQSVIYKTLNKKILYTELELIWTDFGALFFENIGHP